MAYQHGKSLVLTMGSSTIPCTTKDFDLPIDKADVSDDSSGGYQRLIGGIIRGSFNIQGWFDSANPFYTPLVVGGTGTITMNIGNSKTAAAPVLVSNVKINVPHNGAVGWSAVCDVSGVVTPPA